MSKNVAISVDASDEILGGNGLSPQLILHLREDGSATLCSGVVLASDNTTCEAAWNGRDRQWSQVYAEGSIVVADLKAIEELTTVLAPLLAQVHAGRTIKWDGRNNVGVLDDDATEASEVISYTMNEAKWTRDVTVCDAVEWIYPIMLKEITVNTSDDQIEAMALLDRNLAKDEGIILVGNTAEVRREYRDELREMQAEAEK